MPSPHTGLNSLIIDVFGSALVSGCSRCRVRKPQYFPPICGLSWVDDIDLYEIDIARL